MPAYQPVFDTSSNTVKERWTLIRRFNRQWHRIELPEIAEGSEAIITEEQRLGVRLPDSIRHFVSYANDLASLNMFGVLRDCYEMERVDDRPAISLIMQGEEDKHWAVRLKDLKLADPPVHAFTWDFEDNSGDVFVDRGPEWTSVSAFILGHQAGYLQGVGGYRSKIELGEQAIARLRKSFDTYCEFCGMRILERTNLIVFLIPQTGATDTYRIVVEIAEPIPRSRLPAFVRKHSEEAMARHGIFLD